MLIAAVILLRFYPYAAINHEKKGKIRIIHIVAIVTGNRNNMCQAEFFSNFFYCLTRLIAAVPIQNRSNIINIIFIIFYYIAAISMINRSNRFLKITIKGPTTVSTRIRSSFIV